MDLTVEDFQSVLFELYLAQRENNALRAEVAQLRQQAAGTVGPRGGASHADGPGHSHRGHEHDHAEPATQVGSGHPAPNG